ncbi:MAG: DNA polymerase III subunit gamma/tau, partial [Bacteroidota bacterium]
TAEGDALHIIAQKADGALRDALSIFDRIVSSTGKRFGYEDVITNLNILDYDYYFRFTDALLAQDLSQVYLIFDEVQRNGFEGDHFINGLAEHLRNLLVCKDEATLRLLEVSESLRGRYRQQAALSPASFLLTGLNLCNECDVNYKMARMKRLHVEMYLQKMCCVGLAVQVAIGNVQVAASNGNQAQTAQAVLEKKKPDLTPAPQEAPKKAAPAAVEQVENQPSEASFQVNEPAIKYGNGQPDLLENQALEPSVPLTVSPPSNAQPPAPSLLRKLANNLPKLGSLNDFDAEIEEAENIPTTEAKLTQEDLQAAWSTYQTSLEKDSVRMVLKNGEVHLEGEKVVALVGTALAENTIRQETKLMDFLRKQLHAPKLSLEIRIDPAKVPAYIAPAKPLTTSEKYHQMRKTNPLVEEMRKRFDLTLDNE